VEHLANFVQKKVETTLKKEKTDFSKFPKLEKNWAQRALIFFSDFLIV